jgi:putative ABC transport system permease protein
MSVFDKALPQVAVPVPETTARPAQEFDLEMGGISLLESLSIALEALLSNKIRSVLTALGVIIGVGAVVALLAIGRGSQDQIAERITANGANLLTVRSQGQAGGGSATLTLADAALLSDPANVPAAKAVSAEAQSVAPIVAGSVSQRTIVQGVQTTYADLHNSKVAEGTFIDDSQANDSVVVLGASLATKLFPDGGAVGQKVRISNQSFDVIGVMATKGTGATGFDDEAAFVPLAVAQRKLFVSRVAGAGNKTAVSTIVLQAKDTGSVTALQAQIEQVLRTSHNLPLYGGSDDFTIANQQDLISTLTETTRTMTIYLSAIAAISLIVGGIGIMNIMLVSVRERTREIGLRKAIGARERDILIQFLFEALALSLTGGLIGLAIGVAIAVVANATGQARATVSLDSVLLAVGFALAVGLFFGIEPARRAAKLDPIEALRYE